MDVYEELIRERNAGRACALATIVNAVGSIPSYETAKMLVREDGTHRRHRRRRRRGGRGDRGGEGGDRLRHSRRWFRSTCTRIPRMDIGMVCGGSLDVFIEAIRPAPVAYLFGAGHVGALTAAGGQDWPRIRSRSDRRPAGIRQQGALPRCARDPRRGHRCGAGGPEAKQPRADLHRHARPRARRARPALGGRHARRLHRHDRLEAESPVRLRQAQDWTASPTSNSPAFTRPSAWTSAPRRRRKSP